ncbi:SAM-dependent methyltransferase [Marmoricola sp. RAF53]|uniref:SAM-dependent methyltransferase n=1 Tax=Marmoricola sp. RAF53 TaxID=3233059 RepID=UPI003F9A763F
MPDFFEAYDEVLTPLFTAGNLLGLVAGAEEAGLVSGLRGPRTAADLATATGQAPEVVQAVCDALTATGVAVRHGDTYVLTEAWQVLTDPAAFVPLATALDGNAVEGRLLRGLSQTYWTMPREDRLVYARSVSPDPFSDGLVAAFAAQIAADADRAPMLRGGRLLELGCGVAGRVLTTLRAAPALTAVGVELSEDLADEARRRAAELGVADRFTVVCADAADFRDEEPFDHGFWSQFFFPASARAGALAALHAVLRPGASFDAPLGADHDAVAADPTGPAAQEYRIGRVVLGAWGVPDRTPETLVAEIEAAGFVDVHVVPRAGSPAVRAVRP